MNSRREALPFGITLCLSLLLHGAFALLIPGFPVHRSAPKQDTVVVELRLSPEPASKRPPEEATAALPLAPPRPPPPPAVSPSVSEPPPESPPSPAATDDVSPIAAPARPTPETPQVPQPFPTAALSAPRLSAPPAPEMPPEARTSRTESTAPVGMERRPDRRGPLDLMPRPKDLAAFRAARPGVQEIGRAAEEPTVNLRDPSSRFGAYATQVQGAIDQAWSNWREALLAAGRPGVVVVRFTLVPDGTVQEVAFEKRSGSPILDGEAEEAIRNARLPPFPAHWAITRLHLIAQFDYLLR